MTQVLNSKVMLDEAIEDNNIFLLLKHSLTCPISASAKREFEAFCAESDYPCFILNVQETRNLSHSIADEYKVKHESPQILLFKNSKIVWNESHGNITHTVLREKVSEL
ncbi:bacillithiol system redox-active protein YtxJ [Halobacillus massiliensis]|uniref:bacillithiol system redox-active protein YtxJ n=1 Tax=Halobacillus massiliensis TaxID=1926286 RepID=UPI0009E38719|nr:bacillithiol system redox-active protein YtxJ [Halobacillus massiliensis]